MFENLSLDEKRLIVRLPYRIGLYVSEADQSGGEDSDVQEKKTLSNIIHGFAQDVMGAESIQHVISATVMLVDQWGDWHEDLSLVPAECGEAMQIMRQHVSDKDARAFAVQMYEIGEAIALAYQEYQSGDVLGALKMRYAHFKDQKLARKHGLREKSYDEYTSISADERQALRLLSKGLGFMV